MHRSTYCVAQTHSQTAQEQIKPQTALWSRACQCYLWQPPVRQASQTSRRVLENAALGELSDPPQTPRSASSVSQCQWAAREAEAGGIVCTPASWAMAYHCSTRDTPCYPGRGCPMVSRGGRPYRPMGRPIIMGCWLISQLWPCCSRLFPSLSICRPRLIASQGTLSGSHVSMVSVYASTATNNAFSARMTNGSSATACFQMSVQLQSQTSSCQTIMEWQLQCHLPMPSPPIPRPRALGRCLLPLFPILPSNAS